LSAWLEKLEMTMFDIAMLTLAAACFAAAAAYIALCDAL
jgi:hypothetical protein